MVLADAAEVAVPHATWGGYVGLVTPGHAFAGVGLGYRMEYRVELYRNDVLVGVGEQDVTIPTPPPAHLAPPRARSAECVTQDPVVASPRGVGPAPLADFGTVQWSACTAAVQGGADPVANPHLAIADSHAPWSTVRSDIEHVGHKITFPACWGSSAPGCRAATSPIDPSTEEGFSVVWERSGAT